MRINPGYDLIKRYTYELNVNVEQLKVNFKDDINSERRFALIKSVHDLLLVLEKRDVLSEYNLDAIQKIAKLTNNEKLKAALANYSMPVNILGIRNEYDDLLYATEKLAKFKNDYSSTNKDYKPWSNLSDCHCKTTNGISLDKRKRIYKLIAEEIGRNWRDLGRELEVKEGCLDEIENNHPKQHQAKVYALFKYFEENDCRDPRNFVEILSNALDNCHRKDLRRKINELMKH